ncbi:HAD-IIB family hydrolase [Coraliomargarita sp. SDUM461003]|uniref:HAD-IIB family hydrolase n=1 Tax=Thalassobacterium maritimum TaxID=3041265 RepID=A0ABU1AT49_9BACT|nr:HAD-IIB family hydrolase [Coraliomargarita sp. SDUM461003]MDQ8207334.1 HAD-IIB family hydrolase [Coraliomargarita sp. SDUM461003]
MGQSQKLLFVTDLDATFLDHSYSWAQAAPAILRLRNLGLPLVLNSSKTLAEMEDLAKSLDLDSPIVAENGGLLAIRKERPGDYAVQINGIARSEILQAAHELRCRLGYKFAGFDDWSDQELSERTGLSIPQAQRSRSRLATEPITWNDTEVHRLAFAEALSARGIRMLRGGRFWHLMGSADKADGTAAALKFYQDREPDVEWVLVALGDSANDTAMLEAADIAVVIPHADGPHITPYAPRVVHAPFPTSKGWNAAVLSILDEYC